MAEPTSPPAPSEPAGPGPERLAVGDWVGRYQVVAAIGEGGMGAIYRVWDPILDRSVALKAISLAEDEHAGALERFRREAMALAQLNHPNVCQVHDWVEHQGRSYIAMELVEGQTLAEAGPGLATKAKLTALMEVAQALEAAHAKGIVHRDLKPSNIMIDRQGRVKVLDFGLARLLAAGDEGTDPGRAGLVDEGCPEPEGDQTYLSPSVVDGTSATEWAAAGPSRGSNRSSIPLTLAGSFMGTASYAAPEQLQGRTTGPPADLFALGILAWELLLGDHPFPGKGRKRLEATLAGQRKSLRGRKLSRPLSTLLGELLRLNPRSRPTAAQAVAALQRLVAPSHTGRWIAAAAVALVCSLSLTYGMTHRSIIGDLGRDRPARLAVLPIRNGTGDRNLDAVVEVGMTELLATALRESPRLAVVDAEEVGRIISSFHLSAAQSREPGNEALVSRALGAALVLRGSVALDPGSGVPSFRFELAEPGGRIRFHGQVPAPAAGFTAFSLANPAAAQVLGRIDPMLRTPLHGPTIAPATFATYSAGKALLLQGDFRGSEPLLREAAFQAPDFAQAVTAYASCLRRLGRDTTLEVANWAVMASRATGDRWSEGRSIGVKAFLAKDRGDLALAEQLRRNALALAEATQDLDGQAMALNHLGLIALERGRATEAQIWFRQSLECCQRYGDRFNTALAQNNLGNVAMRLGDLAEAIALYRANLAIQEEIGNRWGAALALNNLGVTALTSHDLAGAEGYLTRALALRREVGDRAGESTALRNLGMLNLMRGQFDQALGFQQQSLAVAQACGQRTIEAETRFCLGEIERLQGRIPPALEQYRQVIELLVAGATPEVRAAAQAAQAECLARLPRPRLADAARLLAAAGHGPDSPYRHRAQAWILFMAGQPAEALAELDIARSDPQHQAPEILAEIEATRARFSARRSGNL
jgi:serine/threonine protein kinase/tetratricopeptide (TPR) repeat protein